MRQETMENPLRINTCKAPEAAEFSEAVSLASGSPMRALGLETLQANISYRCNLSCGHCHLEGGAAHTEAMGERDIGYLIKALGHKDIKTLDITGGAPEMHPSFRQLVTEARGLGKHVIVRTNLAIFFEQGYEGLPGFFNDNSVELIASMPCYSEGGVDSVRGKGVFQKSINAIRELNALGYGRGKRALNLVYNPAGAFMPPAQEKLEADYKRHLQENHDVHFDRLFTFTNMPVGRFRRWLESSGGLVAYESMLAGAFNPATIEEVMCRHLISVAPDGTLFDCDFNQAVPLHIQSGCPSHISAFDYDALLNRPISTGPHCYGCTAGSGST